MPCFQPLEAYRRPEGGRLVFQDRGDCVETLAVPCGRCIGCRKDRQQALALRAGHEVQMADALGLMSWFPTLTVDDEHLPVVLAHPRRELQLFHKRVRKNLGKHRLLDRFEYSPQAMRPHFHLLLIGLNFPDVQRAHSSAGKFPAFVSKRLNACWPHGHIDLRVASHDAAMYVAKHHVDKLHGEAAFKRYALVGEDGCPRVDYDTGEILSLPPEFLSMSRRPALGRSWIERYWESVYRAGGPAGSIALKGGRRLKVPAYYDRVMGERLDVDIDGAKFARAQAAQSPEAVWNATADRLRVRQACALAKANLRRPHLARIFS